MAPFVVNEGRLHLLFEVRAMDMRRQPGEVCFPGGKIEAKETPRTCCVRETCEELGVEKDRIRLVGNLGFLYSLLNEKINVFVGEILNFDRSGLQTNPKEVHEIFLVPLDFFLEAGSKEAFHYDGHYIWGLTARAVNQIIKKIGEGLS